MPALLGHDWHLSGASLRGSGSPYHASRDCSERVTAMLLYAGRNVAAGDTAEEDTGFILSEHLPSLAPVGF